MQSDRRADQATGKIDRAADREAHKTGAPQSIGKGPPAAAAGRRWGQGDHWGRGDHVVHVGLRRASAMPSAREADQGSGRIDRGADQGTGKTGTSQSTEARGAQVPWKNKPEYAFADQIANELADLLAPQAGAYYDVWLDGEKFYSHTAEVRGAALRAPVSAQERERERERRRECVIHNRVEATIDLFR